MQNHGAEWQSILQLRWELPAPPFAINGQSHQPSYRQHCYLFNICITLKS